MALRFRSGLVHDEVNTETFYRILPSLGFFFLTFLFSFFFKEVDEILFKPK